MTRLNVTIHDIEDAESVLEETKHQYLRAKGWNYSSSNNPGCFWVWTRTYIYRQVRGPGAPRESVQFLMAPTDLAVKMQQAIDHTEMQEPEDENG